MIHHKESSSIFRLITLQELKTTLNQCAKDKNLGPDGWTIEFFMGFFYLIGEYFLKVVEESKSQGFILRVLHATFIALISKSVHPKIFKDFRPISLCNVMYKLISKVISNRLKPFLSFGISHEQF